MQEEPWKNVEKTEFLIRNVEFLDEAFLGEHLKNVEKTAESVE